MKVLVLNCGSSTVKFQVIETAETSTPTHQDHKLASGLVDHLGGQATFKLTRAGNAAGTEENLTLANHEEAVRGIIERLGSSAPDDALQSEAVGHRVVHGGGLFSEAANDIGGIKTHET